MEVTGESVGLKYEKDGLRKPDSGDLVLLETLLGTSGGGMSLGLSPLSQLSRESLEGKASLS